MEKIEKKLRVCTRCIMDESASDIVFDDKGVCNYCTDFLVKQSKHIVFDDNERISRLNSIVDKVKKEGKGKGMIV